mmetsp:Transcript_16040/g.39664  ORF Transcript_16040/g.39664 Transcript_16040/m.39664 type:complete len:224 (+) Transcript_16040:1241-1912(+)
MPKSIFKVGVVNCEARMPNVAGARGVPKPPVMMLLPSLRLATCEVRPLMSKLQGTPLPSSSWPAFASSEPSAFPSPSAPKLVSNTAFLSSKVIAGSSTSATCSSSSGSASEELCATTDGPPAATSGMVAAGALASISAAFVFSATGAASAPASTGFAGELDFLPLAGGASATRPTSPRSIGFVSAPGDMSAPGFPGTSPARPRGFPAQHTMFFCSLQFQFFSL